MAVSITCKFEDDSIKSESLDNVFSIISLWDFFVAQGRVTPK